MWKFFFDNHPEKEKEPSPDELKEFWVKTIENELKEKKGKKRKWQDLRWQEKAVCKKQPTEWDISVLFWAISECGDFWTGIDESESDAFDKALENLKQQRDKLFHRRYAQISDKDFRKMKKELSTAFDQLLGDEANHFKDKLEQITQSESM